MKIKAEIEVTEEQLKDLLCTAFEGGSNYWVECARRHEAKDTTRAEYIFEVPFTPGNYIELETIDEELKTLKHEDLEKGLKIMAEKYPHHMSDLMNDNADAGTGDTYLQCCVFGEAIYG